MESTLRNMAQIPKGGTLVPGGVTFPVVREAVYSPTLAGLNAMDPSQLYVGMLGIVGASPGVFYTLSDLTPTWTQFSGGGGESGSVVRVVSVVDVPSLSGPIFIDGVSVSADEYVLLVAQINPIDNGVWKVAAGAWTRPLEFGPGAGGKLISITEGSTYHNTLWLCTTSPPNDVIGVNALAYTQFVGVSEFRPSVRVASTANIATLFGNLTVDSVALSSGDRVLLKNQTTAVNNGIWVSSAGAWTRPIDFSTGTSAAGAFVVVREGTTQQDTAWLCTTNRPIDIVDTNTLAFSQVSVSFSATTPATVTSTGATVGVANTVARSDHKHALDTTVAYSFSNTLSTSGTFSATGATITLGNSASVITATGRFASQITFRRDPPGSFFISQDDSTVTGAFNGACFMKMGRGGPPSTTIGGGQGANLFISGADGGNAGSVSGDAGTSGGLSFTGGQGGGTTNGTGSGGNCQTVSIGGANSLNNNSGTGASSCGSGGGVDVTGGKGGDLNSGSSTGNPGTPGNINNTGGVGGGAGSGTSGAPKIGGSINNTGGQGGFTVSANVNNAAEGGPVRNVGGRGGTGASGRVAGRGGDSSNIGGAGGLLGGGTGGDGGRGIVDGGVASGAATNGTVDLGFTNASAVRVSRTGAKVGFFSATPVIRQVSGADLTNNVTIGGTTDTVDDIAVGGVVGTDVRDALYQLARKNKQVNDALRLYGLLT